MLYYSTQAETALPAAQASESKNGLNVEQRCLKFGSRSISGNPTSPNQTFHTAPFRLPENAAHPRPERNSMETANTAQADAVSTRISRANVSQNFRAKSSKTGGTL
jgi:hypothetical protein